MAYERIKITPINGAMGAEIEGVDLSRPLDAQTFDEIHQAFLENLLIVIHDQVLTPEQVLAFARRFGPLEAYPFAEGLPDHPDIFEVRREPQDLRNFGRSWHSDMSFSEIPPVGTMLYAREVPSRGGDTMLTNLYLAYESLSDGMKNLLDGMQGEYTAAQKSFAGGRAALMKTTGFSVANLDKAEMTSVHPIVRTHPETGRKALYMSGSHLARFVDMSDEDSAALLGFLQAHAVQAEFTCRARYRKGTLVLWDNRCTQHRAIDDYPGERRVMHRLTIGGGDRPR